MAWYCVVGSAFEDTLVIGAAAQPRFLDEESIDVVRITREPGGMALNVASHLAHLDRVGVPLWETRQLMARFREGDVALEKHLKSLRIDSVGSARVGCKITGRCVAIAYPRADAVGAHVAASDRCFYVAAPDSVLTKEHVLEIEAIVARNKGKGYLHLANIGGIPSYANMSFVNMLSRMKESKGDQLVITGSTVSYPDGLRALSLAKPRYSGRECKDPDSVGRLMVHALDWLIMSNAEASVVAEECGTTLASHASLAKASHAAEFLYRELAVKNIALTCGENGAVVIDGSQEHIEPEEIAPAPPAEVSLVDPTGAGDAWAAAFIDSLASGQPVSVAARRANYYAARSLGVAGGSKSQTNRDELSVH